MFMSSSVPLDARTFIIFWTAFPVSLHAIALVKAVSILSPAIEDICNKVFPECSDKSL